MEKIYLKKYDSKDTYMSPANTVLDAARVKTNYPATQYFAFVVQTNKTGEIMYGLYNLASMRDRYDISDDLTEDEAITALEQAMNAEREAQAASAAEPTAEERIAAMMEYQVLTSLEDTGV